MRKILWVDVETGGTNYKTDAITQVAVILTVTQGGLYEFKRNWYIKPKDNLFIYQRALDIQRKTLIDISEHEHTEMEMCFELMNLLDVYAHNDEVIIGGFNPDFDRRFMKEAFERNMPNLLRPTYRNILGWLWDDRKDYMCDAAREYKAVHDVATIALEDALKTYGLVNLKPHDALSDIESTLDLYNANREWKSRRIYREVPLKPANNMPSKKMTMEQWRKYKS